MQALHLVATWPVDHVAAAVVTVPTAVTGFYGQNIPYPGFAAHSGFWTSTGIWVGVSILLYAMFKRRRWL